MKEKLKIKWFILAIALLAFLEIVENIFQNEICFLDSLVYQTITIFKTPIVTSFFKIVTQFRWCFYHYSHLYNFIFGLEK